ncbi:Inactive leucine-rich repeat receptor-like serine/threonine-protein kinase [Vitis vinifera]|uniref:Inactive leucine-rich repeat receptor-like serine/threonine-protein kinase n=1 Tax=Vitis vinifera TaxID=29760 RepID=A0A438JR97_VITVI|nr:Inactive leucine-rich repeat receptor-like serine/threonine-protein kinase [Vitis vinifera]
MRGRVTKLVLEHLNLNGTLDEKSLAQLDQLRVLSFKENSLSGQIPDLSGLINLKSLFLNNNNFSGDFPSSLSGLHRLKTTALPEKSLPLNQTSLRFFNVSNNQLSGEIPLTPALEDEEEDGGGRSKGKAVGAVGSPEAANGGGGGNNERKQGGFSWEGEGLGSLVFCGPGDQQMSYSLEDLLKASAETLGRGTMGSTYKAVMESGFIVTVKRLKDARYPRLEEFRAQMELLGRLRHPNLVPLRAYFQAKEERLLVYDYFPNGSLFSLIHGPVKELPPACPIWFSHVKSGGQDTLMCPPTPPGPTTHTSSPVFLKL